MDAVFVAFVALVVRWASGGRGVHRYTPTRALYGGTVQPVLRAPSAPGVEMRPPPPRHSLGATDDAVIVPSWDTVTSLPRCEVSV